MATIYNIILTTLCLSAFIEVFFFKGKKRFLFYIIVFILIFVSGFRYNVGPDYSSYKGVFFEIKNGFSFTDLKIEPGFYYLNLFFSNYKDGFIGVFFITALWAISLKAVTIFKYAHYPILALLFYYLTCYFAGDSGQIRQNLAIGICFYATRYIIDKKFLKFLLFIIIAELFHNTAVMFLFAYFLGKMKTPSTNTILSIFFIIFALSFTDLKYVFNPIINLFPVFELEEKYKVYLDSNVYGQRLGFTYGDITRIIFLVVFSINIKKMSKINKNSQVFFILYVFSVFLYFLLRSNEAFATRLSLYYKIYEILMISDLVYLYRNDLRIKFIYLSFALVYGILLYFRIWQIDLSSIAPVFAKYQNYLLMR